MATVAARSARRGQQITWCQVLMALTFLIVFGVSFAVVFEYTSSAVQSLEADLRGPFYCAVESQLRVSDAACDGGPSPSAPCFVVNVTVDDSDSTRVASAVLHQYYRDYYLNNGCSYTLCEDSGGRTVSYGSRTRLQHLLKSAASLHNTHPSQNHTITGVKAAARCWLDRNKPGRAFLGLEEDSQVEENESSIVFSKVKAYAILIVPPAAMFASVLALITCIATGKVRADEVHEPIITPNHIQIDGKWYMRTFKAAMEKEEAGGSDGINKNKGREAEKWQALRKALQH